MMFVIFISRKMKWRWWLCGWPAAREEREKYGDEDEMKKMKCVC